MNCCQVSSHTSLLGSVSEICESDGVPCPMNGLLWLATFRQLAGRNEIREGFGRNAFIKTDLLVIPSNVDFLLVILLSKVEPAPWTQVQMVLGVPRHGHPSTQPTPLQGTKHHVK